GALPAEHAEVTALLKDAEAKIAAGALPEADRLLRQGYDKVTSMVMAARSGQRLETHRENQYRTGGLENQDRKVVLSRIDTVRAMLDAYRRIAPEKGGPDLATVGQADRLFATAVEQERAGRIPEARDSITKAYDLATGLVSSVRQGDKLVKTLTFASPADEYHYEVDRFNSFRMLLKMAVGDEAAAAVARQAEVAQQEADVLRDDAARAAAGGRYPEAVKTLEKATARLSQAIRATGLFIPG
ncbi:MAG: hypothetical protein H7840_01290, partial [Alphaproteobacteria bacterium]